MCDYLNVIKGNVFLSIFL